MRVAVFIDNSNVYHSLSRIRKTDPTWTITYNPIFLAEKLAGNRRLIGVFFYCVPPPVYLLSEGISGRGKYWKQMGYFDNIRKLNRVSLKYARLEGTRDNLREKNLDTQLVTDMLVLAAQNAYDTAILVANDGDYASAVAGVEKLGRHIELGHFRKGLSHELKAVCKIAHPLRKSFFIDLTTPKTKTGS